MPATSLWTGSRGSIAQDFSALMAAFNLVLTTYIACVGAGFALMKMVGAFGSFLGPSLVGVLSDASGGSYTAAVLVLTAFLLIAFALQLLFPEPGEQHHCHHFTSGFRCILWRFKLADESDQRSFGLLLSMPPNLARQCKCDDWVNRYSFASSVELVPLSVRVFRNMSAAC